MKVVGAGLPRTGTKSLKTALEMLLGGTCYHMTELFNRHAEDLPTWSAATRGDAVDWRAFMQDYTAAVDWPASAFWRELSAAYPDSIIVLTTRRDTDEWLESCEATVFPAIRRESYPEYPEWLAMVQALSAREIGENWDANDATAFYERHNAAVRAEAPPERFLDFRASDGWEPLCAALGVPVPDEPFPHTNTRAEFNA